MDSFEEHVKARMEKGALNKPWIRLSADCIVPQNATGIDVEITGYSIKLSPFWRMWT